MSSNLNVRLSLSHPFIPSATHLEEPYYALLDIQPVEDSGGANRPPLNLVIVLDDSATMHHFQFTDEEKEYWMGLAISRDEIERGSADNRNAVYWKGQTLKEMRAAAVTPMALATQAIKQLLNTLTPSDRVSVVIFADRLHTLFGDQDWSAFPNRCLENLDALREQRLGVDIGTGTFMADAITQAGETLARNTSPYSINRLIVITDGIVQDPAVTLQRVTDVQERGYAITTIGIGEEFDEEFLIRIADNSRGEYHYAADTTELVECLKREVTSLQAVAVTDMYMAVRGLEGAMVKEAFLVRPSMSLFDEIYTEDDWIRARIGDVSSAAPVGVLVQFIPAYSSPGQHMVAEIQLTWSYASAVTGSGKGNEKTVVTAEFTSDRDKVALVNAPVMDLVDRFTVYKYEREAQRAQERGDFELAKDKLGAATKQLHKLGEKDLAQDMEQQMATIGKSGGGDTVRLKRIKSTTRRLANTNTNTDPDRLF
ncbi:hypothetical protein CCAX7_44320 [Capsulimonas corticalis]|uniref:Uncharacterized protein n=1 Tax=Capsulimonas corticalis TaxID=2219043 RepID=A0A402CXA8_9BACT|nr:VWA domain-containing protein [Capsulimonas corticalis]BDI32381.1 hypothetical protein CCAX7_44320 [Capsulimonas corticalis]